MTLLTEKDLLKQCTDYLDIYEKRGELKYWRDNHSRWNKAGFPDLIIFSQYYDNEILKVALRVIMVELKSPKGIGRLSIAQKEWEQYFKKYGHEGCIYIVIDDFDDFQRLLGG